MRNRSFWFKWFLGCVVFVSTVNFVDSFGNNGAKVEDKSVYLKQLSRDVSTEIRQQHGWHESHFVWVNVMCAVAVLAATGLAMNIRRMSSENYGEFNA